MLWLDLAVGNLGFSTGLNGAVTGLNGAVTGLNGAVTGLNGAVTGLNGATPSLVLLIFAPILLLGADYLSDEILKVSDRLNSACHYRAFLYLSVIVISFLVISQTSSSSSYLEAFRVTSESLIGILSALLIAFFVGKWILQRTWKSRDRDRIERLELELPQYLEMFHILITSGMSVLSALKTLTGDHQKSGTISGKQSEMRKLIKEVVAGVESGLAIERALDRVVLRAGSEQLRRFSDAVILGMERGSSMSQTLRNLITETRNQSKVLVMQRAGKAEIQLLIPVVFLILPISVIFAIWPSYVNLTSIMGA